MRFVKMHGLGNDYVYVNGFAEPLPGEDAALAELARRVADRHFGVGGDGLILVVPPGEGVGAHVRMRMFNADGSESEMCGNGVRCVCKLAHDDGVVPAAVNPMRVQTGRGVLTLHFTTDAAGKVDTVSVEMGEPILDLPRVPVDEGKLDAMLAGATFVSMGNPHAVLFVDDVAAVDVERLGPVLEHHAAFPRRINVHWVQVHSPTEVTMRTWERGSGVTLACGTGACAVCVAGVLTHRTAREVTAHLPGGDLHLHWREADRQVIMTGPATEVFRGEWAGA